MILAQLTMKSARSFVRKVRSKSPFRRRKRAETLVAEVRDKEQAYLREINASADQTSQPDDQAEIEVVLESDPYDASSSPVKARKTEDAVPDLVASSSASTDETGPQAAARRFMERQQRLAAGNRRKSFRDRFMRSSKTVTAPPPPSPAQNTKQMGLSVRGRGRSSSSLSTELRERGPKTRERGRSKERTVRGGLIRGSSNKSKSSQSFSENRSVDPLLEVEDDHKELLSRTKTKYDMDAAEVQPDTIDVGAQSRISELSTPAAIIRQESLGNESIRDVRQALQKMELELAAAGDAGKRVSRDKIMNALNFMAHSLHYNDQKEELVKELDAWIDESVIGTDRTRVYAEDDEEDDNSEDDTSYSDDASGSTFDLDAFDDNRSTSSKKQLQTQSSFQDLFLRLGKFFSISEADKTAVQLALGDLLWAEMGDGDTISRRSVSRRGSRSTKRDDGSESSEDSIGAFDPLTCDIQSARKEPSAPTRGRSWWRRHDRGGGMAKKENLFPVQEHPPPSPESKMSVPSPTGKVNPRSSKTKVSGKSSGTGSKSLGSSAKSSRSGSGKSPHSVPLPPRKSALKERTPAAKSRSMLDESEHSGWSSFDETASDFWRQSDRYTIPSKPKASTQQAQLVNHYKLSYPYAWPESDSTFLESPKEDEEFSDWENCLHPPENMKDRRRAAV